MLEAMHVLINNEFNIIAKNIIVKKKKIKNLPDSHNVGRHQQEEAEWPESLLRKSRNPYKKKKRMKDRKCF